jgi:hypothetical protein
MTQPEALRLADVMEGLNTNRQLASDWNRISPSTCNATSSELRRLHEVNQELLGALKEIATAFISQTAPEEYLKQVAMRAIAKATGESK